MATASAEAALPSPFATITAVICGSSFLPTRFGGLVVDVGHILFCCLKKSPKKSAALAWSRSLHTRPSSIGGGQPASLSVVRLCVQEVRLEDVFLLKEHISDTQYGTD